jgi:hypothetical protein
MNERRTPRRGNKRLRSSPDSITFRRKESEYMRKMVVPLACSSTNKCATRHPTLLLPLKPVNPRSFTRILLDIVPSGFSKGDEEEEVLLHYFTGTLLAVKRKEEEEIIIQQESTIYPI